MKDVNVTTIILDICSEHPSAGALACLIYDEVSKLASRTPNIFIYYRQLIDIAKSANNENHVDLSLADLGIAIQVLCNPKVGVLSLNYQFIDDFHEPININISDVIEAEDSGVLEHPLTGELVNDYKRYVFPYFTLNDKFVRECE
ncbi:hypothetical protein GBN32_02080 [Plesiomonas shigelloides]|uniref:hypothetical protein n=1 Tax=Plesiomonas shigelloides TaxID=703 RepID=UPI001261F6E6|nr:hypothetical protein [Plesiomonas shigelloides]KAB7714683.1 hypothetical protein GBN32_02080 [Plesiomonas shigelloides]